MSKTIATNLNDKEFNLLEKRIDELGMSKSNYIKKLVFDDIGIEQTIQKPIKPMSMLDRLKKAFGVSEDVVVEVTQTKEENVEFTRYRDLNDVWEPSKTVKNNNSHMNERTYFFDYETGLVKYKSSNGTCYKSCSLNELLIIHEFNPIYRKDVVELRRILKRHPADNSFAGLIHQYQEGMFDEIISNFKNKVTKCKFKSYYGMLWFMGVESTISESSAKELVGIIGNKGFSETLVYKLCKSYSQCNDVDVRIVCENYNNPQLLDLLKEPNKHATLNNPTKRRNVIRNNGVL